MLSELVQSALICDALVWLHQRVLYACLLLLACHGLLLEATCESYRLLLLFLAQVGGLKIHEL